MWRRVAASHLKTLAAASTTATRSTFSAASFVRSSISPSPSASHFNRCFSDDSVKKRVEDVMPIATRHEREELETKLESFCARGKHMLLSNHVMTRE